MQKPIASLSLDLDNKWCYLRTHGVAGWDTYPSYLDVAVPRILRTCVARDLRLTCFVVGRDAEMEKNGDALATLAAAGHEIGNHSLNHQPWLHTLPRAQLETEICVAEELIERATGQRPVGFRGPAYSLSDDVLEILANRGYLYDASTLPSFIGPLARWYFRHTASQEAGEEAERRELFGSICEGLRSIKPYMWNTAAGPIVEIPVTTMPIVRMPVHFSYLFYLANYSLAAARCYWHTFLTMCRLFRVEPSVLLHPLDLLDQEDEPDMAFFPAMNISAEVKMAFVDEALAALTQRFTVVTLQEHAARAQSKMTAGQTAAALDKSPQTADDARPEPVEV